MTAALRALPFALVLVSTTGSRYAFAQPLTCYAVRPGDTAASLARRFTGDARNRYQPWFQILNPNTAAVIPKSRYGVIHSGWHVCVATAMMRVAAAPVVLPQAVVIERQSSIDVNGLWWGASALAVVSGLVLAWLGARKCLGERQERLAVMRRFGDRFIGEFERPLSRRRADEPAVKSRLRLAPSRHRLEILLAPADGRTYPNLFDHRRNVEYDVERVMGVLNDAPVVTGSLRAEGPWVVIPLRFETNSQQEGAP